MSEVRVRDVLELADLPDGHRLRSVLEQVLRRAGATPPPVEHNGLLWPAEFHGLHRVAAWRNASPQVQQRILAEANRGLLEEAYLIEKAGLAFTAKMVLLARTTEERMLYSLFAADEARHLRAISAWVTAPPTATPFHALLAQAIEEAPRAVLVVLIQVVLEGWGLRHYRQLAAHTTDPRLAAIFEGILEDEAFHHGSGTILANEQPLSNAGCEVALGYMTRFLSMVQPGPVGLAAIVCTHTGADAATVLEDLGAEDHARVRLDILRSLLDGSAMQTLRITLERQGAFEPNGVSL